MERQSRRDVPRQHGPGLGVCHGVCHARGGRRLPMAVRHIGPGATATSFVGGDAPMWLKLTRTGNDFSAYYSMDGINWMQIGPTVTMDMSNDYHAGMAVTSLNPDALCTAQFQQCNDQRQQGSQLDGRRHRLSGPGRIVLVHRRIPGRFADGGDRRQRRVSHHLVELRSGCAGQLGRLQPVVCRQRNRRRPRDASQLHHRRRSGQFVGRVSRPDAIRGRLERRGRRGRLGDVLLGVRRDAAWAKT